ncbi:MAG: hypothetical protein K2J93_00560 [Anaeroplasmataceae bacterium]|nr:hypothetical protein [Anaeroplasmataceae bacterium]
MDAFLNYLCKNSDVFVLRDSTALQYCYDLTRFSDEIILAGPINASEDLHSIVKSFCLENDISYVTDIYNSKEAQFHLIYKEESHSLKVEFKQLLNEEEIVRFDQYNTYSINDIFMKKTRQFSYHKRIRDLYDIVYICENYWDILDQRLIDSMKDSFFYLEYDFFEMIFATQVDELIDTKQLKKDFNKVWKKIGF